MPEAAEHAKYGRFPAPVRAVDEEPLPPAKCQIEVGTQYVPRGGLQVEVLDADGVKVGAVLHGYQIGLLVDGDELARVGGPAELVGGDLLKDADEGEEALGVSRQLRHLVLEGLHQSLGRVPNPHQVVPRREVKLRFGSRRGPGKGGG
eukprot:314131_1